MSETIPRRARAEARGRGVTLSALIHVALREFFAGHSRPARRYRLRWIITGGTRPPAVDPADRNRLYDIMECL
ncbi:MAG: hypothetical protein L0216_06545 [Planctomycetales bacterium]|nr:hypothetical protein [Planctomycetales bacterium]